MACQRFIVALRAHAAGADAAPDLRAHLDGCDACRHELARERRLITGIADDLADALRLEPSADFRARVQERIAGERVAGWRLNNWRLVLVTASLAIVAAVAVTIVVFRTGAPSEVLPPTAPQANKQAFTGPVPHPDDAIRQTLVPHVVDHRASRRPPRVARTHEPEVLVPPDQRMAIERLLHMLREGTLDGRALAPPRENAGTIAQSVAPIVVEELKVPPIDVAPVTVDKRY